MPIGGALLVSGILFGAQHLQIGLLLPLSVTGFFWGVLYVNSRNLLVPVFIHALWNGRIFIGSYLGL
jgi:membrane protease YdiL (CAAX protease family)